MRIYVRLGHGAKELYADLESLNPRERPERLRVLASIGLSVIYGSDHDIGRNTTVDGANQDHADPHKHETHIASKLMGSLNVN